MMGNTYAAVIEQSEKEFVKQWAKIVVSLERAVPKEDAKGYLEAYSIPLGPSDDPRFEQRGVMVIKSKSKTRARQRKGAVGNWKRVLKVTLGELGKRGMSGEELRRIMWGRASITSPTKISKKKQREAQMADEDPFGLSAAVDVMSFAHDIVMIGEEDEEIMIDPVKKKPVTQTVTLPPGAPPPSQQLTQPADGGVSDIMSQMVDAQGVQSQPSTTPHTPKSGPSSYSGGLELRQGYRDPLKDLICLAEVEGADPNDEHFWNRLSKLAEEATLLDHIEECKETAYIPAHVTAEKIVAEQTAASLFQNPKDIVDPVKEAEFLKTLEALVESDSDPEKPVLGKGSLVRRAKSAVSRRTTNKQKQRRTDEHPLFMIAWDEQPLQSGYNYNYEQDDMKTPLDDTMMDIIDDEEATVADEVVMEPDPVPSKGSVKSGSSTSSKARRRKRFGRNKQVSNSFSCINDND